MDEVVFAVFEPQEDKLLQLLSQGKLLAENPQLVSALANIFPYLLLIDGVLEIVTWTNDDQYQNLLWVVVYSVLVLNWHLLKYWVLPAVLATVFSSVVWGTSSVIQDTKCGETPTIDEVLQTMHNLTVRLELFLQPAKLLRMNAANCVLLLFSATLLTPLNVLLYKTVLTPTSFAWVTGVFLLTFHLPWLYSFRSLLWRSAYLRRAVALATGADVRTSRAETASKSHETISRVHTPTSSDVEDGPDKVFLNTDFAIIKKKAVSATQLRQTVRFDILENERRWFGMGWLKFLFPNERASFCYALTMTPTIDPNSDATFTFPVFENDLYSYQWQWMDDAWKLDLTFNRQMYKSGWVYYDRNWEGPRYEESFSRFTRSRKWTRRALLLIDKRSEVLDE